MSINVELVKRFAEINKEIVQCREIISVSDNRLHVRCSELVGMDNLQIEKRGNSDYPYEIFTVIDDVKVFALASNEEMKKFPQFKTYMIEDLKSKIAYLQEDIDLSGGDDNAA